MQQKYMKFHGAKSQNDLQHFIIKMSRNMRIREIKKAIASKVDCKVGKIPHLKHIRGQNYDLATVKKFVDLRQKSFIFGTRTVF